MSTLQLVYATEGKKITVSSNQTIASYPYCQNRITYSLTAENIKKEYESCKPGQACFQGATPIKCKNEQGTTSTLLCCPPDNNTVQISPLHRNGTWSDIDGRCSGACETTMTAFLNCSELVERVQAKQSKCLADTNAFCNISHGLFSTTQGTPVLTSYGPWCSAKISAQYLCLPSSP